MTPVKQPWNTSQSPVSPSVGPYPSVYYDATSRHSVFNEDLYGVSTSGARITSPSKFNFKHWSKRRRIIAGFGTIVILVGVIVGAVLGTRAPNNNKYPDYTYLHYTQSSKYQGSTFFDDFTYFNAPDPAEGEHIIYDNRIDAQNQNVTGVSASGRSYLRLNMSVPAENNVVFAHSARITSKTTFNNGLFLFDVYHTPYGCAVWPAVWLMGPQETWPAGGEIDIIEAVNKGTDGVQTTLHTSAGCSMDVKRKMLGKSLQDDCHNTTNHNAGCGVQGPSSTFGEAVNAAGGGVWALEWRVEGIRSWFFSRTSIPADVQAGLDTDSASPDPSKWGEPLADFPSTQCDIHNHFKDMQLIANIDTCGQYAGTTFGDQCGISSTCADYVQANPDKFDTAYWEFGAWKVFEASRSAKRSLF